jgi:hypothetical protein
MKSIILAAFAIISFLSSAQAFAEYCPTSAKINAESQLALDNLEVLEDEVNSLYSRSSYVVVADINTIRAVLMSVNSMSDQNYNSCINIKATFYTINFSINNLSENLKAIMYRDRNSPLRAFWNTFLSSFLTLERTIETSPGRYTIPRGPFYRRFFGVDNDRNTNPCQIRSYGGRSVIVCSDAIIDGGTRRTYSRRTYTTRRSRRTHDRRSRRWNRRNPNVNPNVNPNMNPNMNPNVNPGVNPNVNPNVNPSPNPGTRGARANRRGRRIRR